MTGGESPRYRWYHKLLALLGAVVSFEVGVFLVIFPWTGIWTNNYLAGLVPQWGPAW